MYGFTRSLALAEPVSADFGSLFNSLCSNLRPMSGAYGPRFVFMDAVYFERAPGGNRHQSKQSSMKFA
jgi:hypothetical protein